MNLYIRDKNITKLDEWLVNPTKNYINTCLKLILPFKKYSNINNLKKLENILNSISNYDFCSVDVIFETDDYNVDMEKLKLVNNYQQKLKANLFFYDEDEQWPFYQVVHAHNIINQVATDIKELNLSPIEQLLYAYLFVTQFEYKIEANDQTAGLSRSLYGVLNSDKIVCAGYCNLLKAIIQNLDTNNIKLFYNLESFVMPDEVSMHATLISYIRDNKYNVDGYYYLDPTNDSDITYHEDIKDRDISINAFLVPLCDLKHTTEKSIVTLDSHFIEFRYLGDDYNFYDNKPEYESYLSLTGSGFKLHDKEFNKYLNTNLKIIDDLNQQYNKIKKDNTPLCKYLKKDDSLIKDMLIKNSKPISLDVYINALNAVLKTLNITENKKDTFLYVKKIINNSIENSREYFTKKAKNEIRQCEEFYKEKQ